MFTGQDILIRKVVVEAVAGRRSGAGVIGAVAVRVRAASPGALLRGSRRAPDAFVLGLQPRTLLALRCAGGLPLLEILLLDVVSFRAILALVVDVRIQLGMIGHVRLLS